METRVFNGYFQVLENGQWVFTHIRAMEKKLGRPIPRTGWCTTFDGNKQNNKYEELVAITRGIHGRIHGNYPNACFRCGHDAHWVADCYAKKDYANNPIEDIYLRR